MPLVLAITTSLWKQISTRPMQSPLPSFIFLQSHSGLTAGTALITVHHTPCCLTYSTCLLKDACLYFIASSTVYHSRTCTVPRAETISDDVLLTWHSAPLLVPPDTSDRGTTIIFLQTRRWPLLDTFPSISRVLRNTVDLYKSLHGRAEKLVQLIFRCTAEIRNTWGSLSPFILLLAALYTGKQIALITLQKSTPSLLLSEAKSNRVFGRWGVRVMPTGADTPYTQSVSSRRWWSS